MKSIAWTVLAAACLLGSPVIAQQVPSPTCVEPAATNYGGIRYFLGIEPSDGILDVWCRLQRLPAAKRRVRIEFPVAGAGRTTEFEFTGSPTMPREVMANYIQSLLPASAKAPARDKDNQPFSAVLDSIVQGSATKTPDGQILAVPRAWPPSKALALWEPVTLRVRPIVMGGKEFALAVTFKPSPGRFMLSMQGRAEQFILRVLNESAMRYQGLTDDADCTAKIPVCKGLSPVLDVHAPWLVDQVQLIAEGGDLSGATQAVFPALTAPLNKDFIEYDSMRRFNVRFGEAEINARDKYRELTALAIGDDAKQTGTTKITVVWKERPNTKDTYATRMYDWFHQETARLLLQHGSK